MRDPEIISVDFEAQRTDADAIAEIFARGFKDVGLPNVSINRNETWLGGVISIAMEITSPAIITKLTRAIVELTAMTETAVQVRVGELRISVPGKYRSSEEQNKTSAQLSELISNPPPNGRARVSVGLDEVEPITAWPRRAKK